jgi:hypothetical protein
LTAAPDIKKFIKAFKSIRCPRPNRSKAMHYRQIW